MAGLKEATEDEIVKISEDLKFRGKKPVVKSDGTISLNYLGRVKRSSRKNVQLEWRFKSDKKIKIVL